MFTSLKDADHEWRRHHRRFMDDPSIIRDIALIASMLSALIALLIFMPI